MLLKPTANFVPHESGAAIRGVPGARLVEGPLTCDGGLALSQNDTPFKLALVRTPPAADKMLPSRGDHSRSGSWLVTGGGGAPLVTAKKLNNIQP